MLRNHSAPINFAALPQQTLTTTTIFTAVENTAGYQHHPFFTHYDGLYWAMWSSGLISEDQPQQRVCFATSSDGLTWSYPIHIMSGEADRRYTAMGFWLRGSQFYAVACNDNVGVAPSLRAYPWTGSAFSTSYTELHSNAITYHPFQQMPNGDWACFCADTERDDFFMVGDIGDWTLKPINPPPNAVLSEPHFYALPSGALAAIFRDNNNSRRLYRGFSGDLWDSYSIIRSNFPDTTSKSASLRLSNDKYVLVSNPKTDGTRNPLTLAVSDDGDVFDRMTILRSEATAPLYAGGAKNAGYQYPNLLEHDGYLWVIYSRNKEDVQVSRIAIGDIV